MCYSALHFWDRNEVLVLGARDSQDGDFRHFLFYWRGLCIFFDDEPATASVRFRVIVKQFYNRKRDKLLIRPFFVLSLNRLLSILVSITRNRIRPPLHNLSDVMFSRKQCLEKFSCPALSNNSCQTCRCQTIKGAAHYDHIATMSTIWNSLDSFYLFLCCMKINKIVRTLQFATLTLSFLKCCFFFNLTIHRVGMENMERQEKKGKKVRKVSVDILDI